MPTVNVALAIRPIGLPLAARVRARASSTCWRQTPNGVVAQARGRGVWLALAVLQAVLILNAMNVRKVRRTALAPAMA